MQLLWRDKRLTAVSDGLAHDVCKIKNGKSAALLTPVSHLQQPLDLICSSVQDFLTKGGILLGEAGSIAAEKKSLKGKLASKGAPLFGRGKLIRGIMQQELDLSSGVLCTL